MIKSHLTDILLKNITIKGTTEANRALLYTTYNGECYCWYPVDTWNNHRKLNELLNKHWNNTYKYFVVATTNEYNEMFDMFDIYEDILNADKNIFKKE